MRCVTDWYSAMKNTIENFEGFQETEGDGARTGAVA